MADEKQKQHLTNQNNGNIVVINSRDVSQLLNAGDVGLKRPQQSEFLKGHNGDAKSVVELSDIEESFDRSRRTPADMLPGLMLDIFKHSSISQPGSKFNLDRSTKKRQTIDSNPADIGHTKKSFTAIDNLRDFVHNVDEDIAPETESLFEDQNPEMGGLTIGIPGQYMPTLGALPIGNDQAFSTVSVGEDHRITSGPKSVSKLMKLESPAVQRNRSVSTPDLEENQENFVSMSKKHDSRIKSFIQDRSKNDTSLNNINSDKSKFVKSVNKLSMIKRLTSKSSLNRSAVDARDLDAEGGPIRLKENLNENPDSTRSVGAKEGNRLMKLILKHASSGNLNPEAEVFQRIMKRLHPEKLAEVHKKKHKPLCNRLTKGVVEFLSAVLHFFTNLHQPDEIFIIMWNFIGLLFVILNSFYVPFMMSFEFTEKGTEVALAVNIYFALNIVINFRTAYYSKGMLITDQKKVFKNALNFSVVLEVLAVVCGVLYLVVASPDVKYLTFFTLIRVRHSRAFIAKIEDHSQLGKQSSEFLKLLWLILVVLTLAHLSGCIFHQIAYNELSTDPENWLVQDANSNAPVYERYVDSLYWAFATMITVGYGDIVPSTTKERVYTVVIMAVACGVFGYFINTIGYIFNQINGNRSETRHKIRQITNYMKRKRLSRAMQVRVRKYLEYILEGEMTYNVEEQKVLQLLSEPLRNEISTELNLKALRNCKVFTHNFTEKFLVVLAKELKEATLSPEQIIFKERDDMNSTIYFILNGKIQIFIEKSNAVFITLAKGEFFGEISFFSNRPRSAGAKSVGFSSVLSLSREAFLEAAAEFSHEREQFFYTQDRIIFENNIDLLTLKCYSCQEEGHVAGECPKVHYCVDNRQKALQKHIADSKERRKEFKRKHRERFSPQKNIETLVNDSIKLRSTLENIEAILIQTRDAETFNNCEEFDEILNYKIYIPFFMKHGLIQTEAPVIGSIESVENLNNMPNKQSPSNLQPPNQLAQSVSRETIQPLLSVADNMNYQNPMYLRQSSGGYGQEGVYRGGSKGALPMQNSQQRAEAHRFKFDMVKNFETYYPHGNIMVISEKYNISMNERMIARAIERTTGKTVSKNILKGIDILSRGSIYGGIKKSTDSLLSIKSAMSKQRNESEVHSILKGGSFISSQLAAGSSFQGNSASADANQSDSPRKYLTPNQSSSAKKSSSVFLNPEKLGESSAVSSSSVVIHSEMIPSDSITSKRRPSRFGLISAQLGTKMPSSQNIGSESQSNFLGLQEERVGSYAPSSFVTDQNPASSIIPRSNEPELSSNNNLINFWKDRQRSKSSFQRSEENNLLKGNESYISPRFRKSSADESKNSRRDSKANQDQSDNDTVSQVTSHQYPTRNNDDLSISGKFSSDKKVIQNYIRKALHKLKETDKKGSFEKRVSTNKSRFSVKTKEKRPRSVGQESKLARLIRQEGPVNVLRNIIVSMRSDAKVVTRSVFMEQNFEDN